MAGVSGGVAGFISTGTLKGAIIGATAAIAVAGVASFKIPTDTFGGVAANAAAYGTVGGVTSVLGGGKFANGFGTAAFLYLGTQFISDQLSTGGVRVAENLCSSGGSSGFEICAEIPGTMSDAGPSAYGAAQSSGGRGVLQSIADLLDPESGMLGMGPGGGLGFLPAIGVFAGVERAVAGVASRAVGSSLSAAEQLAANRAAGAAFEQATGAMLRQRGFLVGEQVTVRTASGKTRLDFLTRDPLTGVVSCIECKASQAAPLTVNQTLAFPSIERSGGIVVGRGKPGFPGGTKIPPTTVEVIRGP